MAGNRQGGRGGCGRTGRSLAKILDETGDIGLAVEELLESERPIAGEAAASEERHAQVRSSAIASATGVLPVAGAGSAPTLRSLPEAFAAIRGASGQRRHDLLMQLFYGTSPIAAKYIVRMLSGDVQIGLRDGLLEGAIAAAFGADVSAVRRAMTLEGMPAAWRFWRSAAPLLRQSSATSIRSQPCLLLLPPAPPMRWND